MPSVEERYLPPDILSKAVRSGEEYGWQFDDLPAALAQARTAGLAVLGGQVQFKLPDGICELYWQNADSAPQQAGEPWDTYVERSHREVRAGLDRLPSAEALVNEGLARFAFLKQRAVAGVDLGRFLCFVCYFEAQE